MTRHTVVDRLAIEGLPAGRGQSSVLIRPHHNRREAIMPTAPHVIVARVYEPPTAEGGIRVLVDRLWPRGLTKSAAAVDVWCHAIAPSTELRKWFGHDPIRLGEFIRRYESELEDPDRAAALTELEALGQTNTLTLLTATKNVELSHAPFLARLIGTAQQTAS
jgi:uncharacterized protein YeaO (DUF488 family)